MAQATRASADPRPGDRSSECALRRARDHEHPRSADGSWARAGGRNASPVRPQRRAIAKPI